MCVCASNLAMKNGRDALDERDNGTLEALEAVIYSKNDGVKNDVAVD